MNSEYRIPYRPIIVKFYFGCAPALHCPFEMAFPFENLEVYKQSIQFVSETETLIHRERIRISKALADQFCRAALSIPLNIAEGNGRWHKGDKRNFFWIARGSVFECVPIIEILRIKNLITPLEHEILHGRLEQLGKMLSALIKVYTAEK
ncbi:MAG: four helix bundle protein [Pseudobdellovibrionaceae bacterium]